MRRSVIVLIGALVLAAPAAPADEPAPDEALAKILEVRDQRQYARALEELQELLDSHPKDVRILVELAKTAYWQANEILNSESPSLGRLALEDAIRWSRKTLEVDSGNVTALQIFGAAAVSAGDFERGVEAYSKMAAQNPEDGESHYWHGYCLAFANRFEEAIGAFEAAQKALGPQARIRLNRGICHESLGQDAEARRWFTDLIDAEVAAGRANSAEIRSAWEHLWKIFRVAKRWDEAAEVFRMLAERHPKLSSPHWYLAHVQQERGDNKAAAAAFAKVTEILPTYVAGWERLGDARVQDRDFAGAEATLVRLIELKSKDEAPRDFLLRLARRMTDSGKADDAVDLLERFEPSFAGNPWVMEARADLLFRRGDFGTAFRLYRQAVERASFSDSLKVKEQKAVTALLRSGAAPRDAGRLRPQPEKRDARSSPRPIFDFEGPNIFVRVGGRATGAREAGRFSLKRTGDAGRMAYLKLDFLPTIDTRGFKSLRIGVNGPEGTAMVVRAKDCYDQFEMNAGFVRLQHLEPVRLTGEWQTATMRLDEFRSFVGNRRIPFNRARLRTLIFEIGAGGEEKLPMSSEITLDDVVLVAEDGTELVLADFESSPREALFLSEGAASAFARTLFSEAQVAEFRPDPNTYVSPSIFGEEYDKSTTNRGTGSFRLHLPREGAASGVLQFNPDRSIDRATAITFWAKGVKGGEKLRVTIRDALDDEMGNQCPSSSPRLEADSRILDGWFVLKPDWTRYRIERKELPDVHFDSLLEIRFHFGTTEGNEPGTTLYIDDIEWE